MISVLKNENIRLGFGCSGALGKPWFPEKQVREVLHAALKGGITHIDTAGFYGEAERRLGCVLKNMNDDAIFVSTKTGTSFTVSGSVKKDFSKAAIITGVDASLKRLGRERLDLLYLHGPNSHELAACETVLTHLKTQGKIRYAGICGEGTPLEDAASLAFIDVLMGRYNIIHREHAPIFAKQSKMARLLLRLLRLCRVCIRKNSFYQVHGRKFGISLERWQKTVHS